MASAVAWGDAAWPGPGHRELASACVCSALRLCGCTASPTAPLAGRGTTLLTRTKNKHKLGLSWVHLLEELNSVKRGVIREGSYNQHRN